jgi:uncharacterized protein DUF1707/uncharacterized protein DUF4190
MATGSYYGQMRATDADRERINTELQNAYADGRLTWEEFDARASKLVVAKTHDQLAVLTTDLRRPVPYRPNPAAFAPVRTGTNPLPGISLAFGIGQPFLPIIGAIIAIVCGHVGRSQLKKTDQPGDGLALAGLILGYLGLAIPLLIVLLITFMASR